MTSTHKPLRFLDPRGKPLRRCPSCSADLLGCGLDGQTLYPVNVTLLIAGGTYEVISALDDKGYVKSGHNCVISQARQVSVECRRCKFGLAPIKAQEKQFC